MKLLDFSYYENQDTIAIAKDLLGKVLVSRIDGVLTSGIITETEAYLAPEDQASHAKNNNKTPKNETMYASGGTAYVYKCYGIHDLLNVVTGPEGQAHAILIRAIEPLDGLEIMKERRKIGKNNYVLTGGPGKVSRALGVTSRHDGISFADQESELNIYDSGNHIKLERMYSGPRVGMSVYTGKWAHSPYRYYIRDNKWVSRPLDIIYPKEWK